jgi:hypothetical protein
LLCDVVVPTQIQVVVGVIVTSDRNWRIDEITYSQKLIGA